MERLAAVFIVAVATNDSASTEGEKEMSDLNRKDDAERNARNLVARLKGKGWKPVVFENMGWHWRAVSGPVQVYPSGTGDTFWCMVGSEPKYCAGGAGWWTPQRTRCFKDPNRAVRNAMKHVYEFRDRIIRVIAAAENAMDVKPSGKGKGR